jgi:hypothetical protein
MNPVENKLKEGGTDLLSHRVAPLVPSALVGLTSGFGMETGCFPTAINTTHLYISIFFHFPLFFIKKFFYKKISNQY